MNIIKPTHISKFCIDIELIFQTATDLLVLVTQDCCENIKTNFTLITMFTLTTVLIYTFMTMIHMLRLLLSPVLRQENKYFRPYQGPQLPSLQFKKPLSFTGVSAMMPLLKCRGREQRKYILSFRHKACLHFQTHEKVSPHNAMPGEFFFSYLGRVLLEKKNVHICSGMKEDLMWKQKKYTIRVYEMKENLCVQLVLSSFFTTHLCISNFTIWHVSWIYAISNQANSLSQSLALFGLHIQFSYSSLFAIVIVYFKSTRRNTIP